MQFERKLQKTFNNENFSHDINGELLKARVPLHFGGVSDPFSNYKSFNHSIKVLHLIHKYQYPIVISTKQTEYLLNKKIFKILKSLKSLLIQISVPIPDEEISKKIEIHSPTLSNRLNAIKFLIESGFNVSVRLQPLILPLYDKVIREYILKLHKIGCKHLIFEFLKIPIEKNVPLFKEMYNILEWNGYEFYRDNKAIIVGRDWVLPTDFVWIKLKPILILLNQLNIKYSTTDHGLFHMRTSESCCGFSNIKGFENYYKANFAYVLKQYDKDLVSFSEVTKHWFPTKSIKKFINSNSRIEGENNFYSLLRNKWNNPRNINSPEKYFGINDSGFKDDQSNIIYDKSAMKKLIAEVNPTPLNFSLLH